MNTFIALKKISLWKIVLLMPGFGVSYLGKLTAQTASVHIVPAPLYLDPVTDGAADPVLVWNRREKPWWILYTQRRANLEGTLIADRDKPFDFRMPYAPGK